MKGLSLAKAYFFEYGLPMIEEEFGRYAGRIAAGIAGPGSECYGEEDRVGP